MFRSAAERPSLPGKRLCPLLSKKKKKNQNYSTLKSLTLILRTRTQKILKKMRKKTNKIRPFVLPSKFKREPYKKIIIRALLMSKCIFLEILTLFVR